MAHTFLDERDRAEIDKKLVQEIPASLKNPYSLIKYYYVCNKKVRFGAEGI